MLAIPAMLLASCGPKGYTINGQTGSDMEGQELVLMNGEDTVATCTVTDSTFTFAGTVENQDMYTVVAQNRPMFDIFVQEGAVITADLSSGAADITDNGGLNDIYGAVIAKITEHQEKYRVFAMQMRATENPDSTLRDSIMACIEGFNTALREGYEANKDNYVGAHLMGMVAGDLFTDTVTLDSAMAEVKYAQEVAELQELRARFVKMAATAEGKMFVDFTGFNLKAEASKLSDYVGKGKYVLVDFWASWCRPCMGEVPNLLKLHSELSGENFTVLGVNVWDSEEGFKSALDKEGINYPQIYIPRDNADNATDIYGISGIPQIILFGPDGIIIKRNLRGEEMINFVTEQVK